MTAISACFDSPHCQRQNIDFVLTEFEMTSYSTNKSTMDKNVPYPSKKGSRQLNQLLTTPFFGNVSFRKLNIFFHHLNFSL